MKSRGGRAADASVAGGLREIVSDSAVILQLNRGHCRSVKHPVKVTVVGKHVRSGIQCQ
jgi:hypothetical protein